MAKDKIPGPDATNKQETETPQPLEDDNEACNPDPFDPARLRLSQDFTKDLEVEKVLTRVPVRKPHDQELVRVRPGEEWQLPTWILLDKVNQGEVYLVAPEMILELRDYVRPALVVLVLNRQGNPSLWPLKLPSSDGQDNIWNQTGRQCAKLAEQEWICVKTNRTAGYYEAYRLRTDASDPEWPSKYTMRGFLRLGFGERFIDRPEHPIAKQLRGEE